VLVLGALDHLLRHVRQPARLRARDFGDEREDPSAVAFGEERHERGDLPDLAAGGEAADGGAECRRGEEGAGQGEERGVEEVDVPGLGEDVEEARGGGGGVWEPAVAGSAVAGGEVREEAVHGAPGEREPRGGLEEELAEVGGCGGKRQRGEAAVQLVVGIVLVLVEDRAEAEKQSGIGRPWHGRRGGRRGEEAAEKEEAGRHGWTEAGRWFSR